MSEVKPYKKQEVQEECVAEPASLEYAATAENAAFLDDEILVGAIGYMQMAREKGRMISQEEVYGLLTERMGWK